MRVLTVGVLFLLGLAAPTLGASPDSRMTFTVVPPSDFHRVLGFPFWRVYAEGPIDPGAPERLHQVIEAQGVPNGALFHLNSPGGNLAAGIKIGKTLRAKYFRTYVGRIGPANTEWKPRPGECYSACTIAFLGGYFRFLDAPNSFGVHRISKPTKSSQDFDLGQIAAATVTEYLKEMDIDPAFLSYMITASSEEIRLLDRPTLEKLGVVNNGALPPSWTVQANSGLIYLRGMQDTTNGLNKAIFICNAGKWLNFVPFYDVGSSKRANEIISSTGTPSLIIDGDMHPLPVVTEENPSNYNITGEYLISSELAYRMRSARSIGFALRKPNPAFYNGFDIPVKDGRETLMGFLQNCFGH